eukprot:TRINITY_DN5545_c0_g1_i15.p21 TRINITY_DN5545_c0_g1~~TRINITY_DN5545_c0_g1_i15.p21  ORF type:complete len:107 (-),score=2.60 TRINITY_DN5545_c0_g1_i15:2529-2849(-)
MLFIMCSNLLVYCNMYFQFQVAFVFLQQARQLLQSHVRRFVRTFSMQNIYGSRTRIFYGVCARQNGIDNCKFTVSVILRQRIPLEFLQVNTDEVCETGEVQKTMIK